ncbi:serpin B6-like [Pollicipes pollicipes]|uniref:serpin B6-like n=1 Tax=Pollicipes pollicipes TaxID=41117 RepID=UPI0018854040|nr:serpin B6-like [Pollicipes pollicipes]
MTLAGAAGDTAKQMRKTLGHAEDAEDVHSGYQSLLTSLENVPDAALNTANRLYLQKSFKVRDSFATTLKERYRSEALSVDFADTTGTSRVINEEVARLTRGKIQDLVPASSLSAAIRLVLVNAVHFKAGWQHKFNKEWTEEGDFFAPGETLRVKLMTLDGKMLQGSNDCGGLGCQAVELPFVGYRFSMLLLLPREKEGLPALEARLAKTDFAALRASLHSLRSRVVLPRFRLETGMELRGALERLGMSDAFDGKRADLSGIAGARDLVVDSVLHRACIAVDEEGCEAAAATAVMVGVMAILAPELLDFRADHPFLAAVVDRETGVPLFLGRVARP